MTPLYYSALADPKVAPALAKRAHRSLQPFASYLRSALRAARSRESRSRSRWEPVPAKRTISLHALDRLVEIRTHRYRVIGWSGPVPSTPMFVGDEFRPVKPTRVVKNQDEIVVYLDEALDLAAVVWWSGQRCALEAVPWSGLRAFHARRRDGSVVSVLHCEEVHGRLRLVVEGRDPVVLTDEGGSEVPHERLDDCDGATELRGARMRIPWNGEPRIWIDSEPDTPVLRANNGVRWSWSDAAGSRRRRGFWVQLLAPEEGDEETTIDPRTAFFDEGVREVRAWTERGPGEAFSVLDVRREDYQLELNAKPPEDSMLFVPSNVGGLRRQLDAIHRLKDAPLPHHRMLLTLCEEPTKARWRWVQGEPVDRWFLLDDDRSKGSLEQRQFVERALGTPDFAFLEGPPGSGKTHAICELILQCLERNQRVLLCSTTHVAVDNVLERLVGTYPQVEAVRIGPTDRVDPRVRGCQIDERVDAILAEWRAHGVLAALGEDAMKRAAEATILAAANLTCGTTTGILAHPYIRKADDRRGLRWPHFDVLILDEASKTTFQEFLVPAQLARKWIIVGDVRQLPPFHDPHDLEASLSDAQDAEGARWPAAWQRALLLLFRLTRREAGAGCVRWLIEEHDDVLDALVEELRARRNGGQTVPEIVRVVEHASDPAHVAAADVAARSPAALRLLAAEWILITKALRERLEPYLPADLLWASSNPPRERATRFRFRHWSEMAGRFERPIRDGKEQRANVRELMAAQQKFLASETWAAQVAWRLVRIHQLATARTPGARDRRQAEIDALMPAEPRWAWVRKAVGDLRDVGIRSVIEALRVGRPDHGARGSSALTDGLPAQVWSERAVLLTHQHRMHPDISALPRKLFYENAALWDAKTLEGRDERLGWCFLPGAPARRVWLDVRGVEIRGVNEAEVEMMKTLLQLWREHARSRRRDGRPWEIACLTFYHRQELAIRNMLRQLTGLARAETRFELPHTVIACGSVDRFQGREADLVLLSLRNVQRAGHLDSPHRLNVAITRARFMLVVIGNRGYFADRCPSEELAELAKGTPPYVLPRAP
ncbi:MAG: AAA domain-containing protein [Myxococcales bacterium]|nr:AAA domain-containing protein [Myxococcales bacterium]